MSQSAQLSVIPLWSDDLLGPTGDAPPEDEYLVPPANQKRVRNISRPTLSVYLPDPSVATGTAVIVCPGGAFHFLAIEHEGTEVARWLGERGIATFLLKYRVVPTPGTVEDMQRQMRERFANRDQSSSVLEHYRDLGVVDGRQAVRLVRERAAEWGISRDRVGMMGFSAGGYVTLGATLQEPDPSRPDFSAPIYPAPWKNIVVPTDAPPLFLALASDDNMAVNSSLPLYSAWHAAQRPVELHVFAEGGHGFGMNKKNLPVDHWIDLFGEWLKSLGLLEQAL